MTLPRKRGAFSIMAALVRGARRNTPMRQLSTYAPAFSVQRLAFRFGLAYELMREIRSVPHRIAEIHSRGGDERGWKTIENPAFPTHLRGVMCQVRNLGIQNLRSRRPWVTALDIVLFLEGLEAGALLQLGNLDTAEQQMSEPLPNCEG